MQFYHPSLQIHFRNRRSDGHAIAEFAPALAILAMMVFLPLLDLTIVPIRWMLAQQLVSDYARKLALCETFSEAQDMMRAEPSLYQRLERLGGVQIQKLDLQLQISNAVESIAINRSGSVPAEWLPNGAKGTCTYALTLQAHSLLSPAILLSLPGNSKIPGLNAPIPLVVAAEHNWGNLAVDPVSRKFYINE